MGKWLPWVKDCKTVKDSEAFIEHCMHCEARKESLTVVMEHNKEIVGLISFRNFDWDNGETLIGYWLGEKYQGKGIVTNACATLLDYAFKELGFKKVRIRCEIQNNKSQAIPEKLGFIREKTVYGEKIRYLEEILDWDMIYNCMDREDWEKFDQGSIYKGKISTELYKFATDAVRVAKID